MITNKINKTKINTKLELNPLVQTGVLVTVWQPHWLFIVFPPFLQYSMKKIKKGAFNKHKKKHHKVLWTLN